MTPVAQASIERRRLRVAGIVQGVGFRPFVYRLASGHGLAGFVRNDSRGVVIEVEGATATLDRFAADLTADAPGAARIDAVAVEARPPAGASGFAIEPSVDRDTGTPNVVGPDLATCRDCLRELFDPDDRRYRYPFINCTACGPRLTIVERVPYDRANTTMARFEICAECRREYEDPGDRRFHAEPIACPECGPRLAWSGDAAGTSRPCYGEDALAMAVEHLREGAIVAVKGLGGYHLACDATCEPAVASLRAAKHREDKPFAVMHTSPASVAQLSAADLAALKSPAQPILLVWRRPGAVAASVAPGDNPWLGLMLPYTPLHHLLCSGVKRPLVMTSGNRSDEPIAFEDADARERLGAIADSFLTHDREIHRRCEDSVVRPELPLRRSRGYAPASLPLPLGAAKPVVAAGAELKATFCAVRGNEAFLSPHLGDLEDELARHAFAADLRLYLEMLGVEPQLIACDLHPGYFSTRWAQAEHSRRLAAGLPAELIEVQHHHAHAAACLAEHGRTGPALALVFDGAGMGSDGTLWGGELLRFDLTGFERIGYLEPLPLPGGDAAIREPWRVAAMYLERAGRPQPQRWRTRWKTVRQSLKVNAPQSSGMGRLYDAAAAVLGVRETVTYEGQAAIELEWLAGDAQAEPYACGVEGGVICGADLIAAAHDDLAAGRDRAEIAAAFHEGVALAATRLCQGAAEPATVVLSGGGFQNLRLLASVTGRLANLGFEVLSHRRVPPNDGGISYGQAAVAAASSGRSELCV